MNLLLVVNIPATAVGTLARLYQLGAPPDWRVEIVSSYELDHRPSWFSRKVAAADLVHWTNHKVFAQAKRFRQGGTHVVSVHHLEGDESSLHFLAEADGLLVHAQSVLAELTRRSGRLPRLIQCLAYPVDISFFRAGRRKLSAAPRTGLESKEPLKVGFFSSAVYENPRKGIDLLPDVMAAALRRGCRMTLLVTGQGWNHVLGMPEFRSLPITHRVIPSYFDMPEQYTALDAYLCLSRLEGGPMTVFESLACGTPVVSTPVGRIPDSLQAGTMYSRIPYDDPEAAALALVALSRDPAQGRVACENALPAISETLSARKYQRDMTRFYAQAGGLAPLEYRSRSEAWQNRQRRHWRAWDRTFWAKEAWVLGRHAEAVRRIIEAFLLDPFNEGIWRVPMRKLGIGRDER